MKREDVGCHLAESEEVREEELRFEIIETLMESEHFELFLCRCKDCGQVYLGCFIEICSFEKDDECWNFWVPLSVEDIRKLREDPRHGVELVGSREHIVWHPDGRIRWRKVPELTFMRGAE